MILFYYMMAKTTIHPSTVSVATDGYLPRLFFTARQISTSSHSHLGAREQLFIITKLMKVEMIKNSAKLYKDIDFHQPNKMTMKKKKKPILFT